MEYGCIGKRLVHSFSKEIHSYLFDYDYELCELSESELPGFFKNRDFRAINVTIPYKQAVIPFLDEIDAAAEKIGAVNTVVNRSGRLYGYNTDFFGLTSLLKHNGIELSGKKVLIAGGGGTSRTAAAVASALGAREIYRLSRSGETDCIAYDEAYRIHSDAGVIINTTPCGMFPNRGSAALDISRFGGLSGVADAVYNPLRSALVVSALERGIPASGGLYMLVAQAVAAAELFTGQTLPEDTCGRVWRKMADKKENVVLVGMPGCGKSTLGKRLADDLGFEFLDTDEEILRDTGKTPAQIISGEGESRFRDAESAVIARLAACQSAVISTGGGAVLREENMRALRENGKIIFVDRPLESLAVTGDRPLSDSREKLGKIYAARRPLYLAAGERAVCEGDLEENLNQIKKAAGK